MYFVYFSSLPCCNNDLAVYLVHDGCCFSRCCECRCDDCSSCPIYIQARLEIFMLERDVERTRATGRLAEGDGMSAVGVACQQSRGAVVDDARSVVVDVTCDIAFGCMMTEMMKSCTTGNDEKPCICRYQTLASPAIAVVLTRGKM